MITTPELALRVVEIVAILFPLMVIVFQLLIKYVDEDILPTVDNEELLASFFVYGAVSLTLTGTGSTVILYGSRDTVSGGLLMLLLYVTLLLVGAIVIGMGLGLRSELLKSKDE